jgi:hypothetical protein
MLGQIIAAIATLSLLLFIVSLIPISNAQQTETIRNNVGPYWSKVTPVPTARTETAATILEEDNNNIYVIAELGKSDRSIGAYQAEDDDNNNNNNSNAITNTDLINNCFAFRDIMSETGSKSCDHSMLYYKGQCEYYSDMNKSGTVLNSSDFNFCSNSKIDIYINKNNLTHSPRSSSLIQ